MDKNPFLNMQEEKASELELQDGSKVAIIGAGPAGSFFAHSLLVLCKRMGIEIKLDIFEAQDFCRQGPAGCNHCGGIISESLVQILASEGINIPPNVIQKGIDSYVLHTDVGSARIDTPLLEKRIAAVYRGAGPLGEHDEVPASFDAHMVQTVVDQGATLIRERVRELNFVDDYPVLTTKESGERTYDFVVGSNGVNSSSGKLFEGVEFDYKPPVMTKTFICEFPLGEELIEEYFGHSMHVFLLNISRLKFAAFIPKGPFVTLVLLGDDIDKDLVNTFLDSEEVKACFPKGLLLKDSFKCQCFPKINISPAISPYRDRLVLIGDAAVTRLYKDGIGAAYSTAKAAANTAVLYGISADDFKKHYMPACKKIDSDNNVGKFIFLITALIQRMAFTKRGMLRLIRKEQLHPELNYRLSTILWDTFTGSSPYKIIFKSSLNLKFLLRLLFETGGALFSTDKNNHEKT